MRNKYLQLLEKHNDDDILEVRVAKLLVNDICDDFESRTCQNCKDYRTDYGLCVELDIEVNKSFCCNKWEIIDER